MTMLQHGLVPSTGGYQIERSLRFNSADSAYLNRTPASAGNRRTWTFSFWLKRTTLGTATTETIFCTNDNDLASGNFDNIRLTTTGGITDKLEFYSYSTGYSIRLITTQVFRDPSAWYHFVIAVDTTQATASNRVKIYLNGSQITAFTSETYPSQNYETYINNAERQNLGVFRNVNSGLSQYLNGYITEFYNIDGSALTPSSFGETDTDTGVWKPKAYTGTYGTNGFYLKFADNSGTTSTTLGKDSSGNGNNWTPNNFSVTAGAGNDSLVDTPTPYGTDTGAGGQVRGNYCTLNPLDKGSAIALANGNLDIGSASNPNNNCRGTFGMSSGKWYFEFVITSAIGGVPAFGIGSDTASLTSNFSGALYLYLSNGTKAVNGVETAYGATFTQNDVIGVAFDADNNSITFYKNNSSQGAITGVTSGLTWRPFVHASITTTITSNFGQRPFAYTAPSGFKALCTQNLPTPTIGATATTRADDYFNTVLYTGNGSTQSIAGVGFQPDFTWIKSRSGVGDNNLTDAVRGATKTLFSNETAFEYTLANGLTSFNSDGFSVGNNSGFNTNTTTYASWNWKANGAGSTNNAGSIQSTVSASTLSGFSVVTMTYASVAGTVGHGLGATPSMIIVKRRDSTSAWVVAHSGLTNMSGYYLLLNATDAQAAASWGGSPTSAVFNMSNNIFASGDYVAYCFAPIAGYSAFGKYTGNGSADGAFVYTGFRPKWILIKSTDAVTSWLILDSTRNTYNLVDSRLFANLSSAEDSGSGVDLLSNGFKLRSTSSQNNDTIGYIYAAFAEVPTKFSLAR